MFHAYMRKTEELYAAIHKDPASGAVRSIADKVMAYHTIGRNAPVYPEIHCILAVLTSESFGDAVWSVADLRKCSNHGARTVIQKAMNSGPEFTDAEREVFYEKGLLYSGGKYYSVGEKFKKGGRFDETSRLLSPDARVILDAALSQWLSRESKVEKIVPVSENDLLFVATQLLPEGREKEIRLNDLSIQSGDKLYKTGLAESRVIIQAFAQHLKKTIPSGLLGEECDRRKKPKGLQKPIDLKKIPSISFTQAGEKNGLLQAQTEPSTPPEKPDKDRDPLYKALKALKGEGKITATSAYAYYELHGPKTMEGRSLTLKDIAAKISQWEDKDVPPNVLLMRMAEVKRRLPPELVSNNMPVPSNGNLHEARAVRP